MPKIPTATGPPLVPGYRDFAAIARSEASEVYRAYQDGVDRPVAIKVLLLDDEEAVQRFEREVDITVQLGRQHPHIVTVLDVRTTVTGRPCIVMEYYDRGSLHDRLRERGPLPADEVLAAGIAVADALAFAHGHGVLHRDIKPQNVLVLPTTYVLADFGIARRVDAGHTSSVEWFSFRHAAPQVLDGEPPAVQDDIWSVGSTLFTLLEGASPFAQEGPEDSALAYMKRVRAGQLRTPHRTDVPPGLVDIVVRCLRQSREDRFPDAAALHQALRDLAADTRGWAPQAIPAAPPSVIADPEVRPSPVVVEGPTAARSGPMSPHTMARLVASAVSAGGYEAEPVEEPESPPDLPRDPGRVRRLLPRIAIALVLGGLLGTAGTFILASANQAGQQNASPTPDASGTAVSAGGTVPSKAAPTSATPSDDASSGGTDVNDPRIAPVITVLEARGDEGVFLRWTDRSGGAAAFVVVQVGSRGDPLKTVPPGVTQAAIGGLDPATAPYCFHVIALVGADQRGVSAQRCLGTP